MSFIEKKVFVNKLVKNSDEHIVMILDDHTKERSDIITDINASNNSAYINKNLPQQAYMLFSIIDQVDKLNHTDIEYEKDSTIKATKVISF
jgi:hypothetical protein